jgi:hypothetical protein
VADARRRNFTAGCSHYKIHLRVGWRVVRPHHAPAHQQRPHVSPEGLKHLLLPPIMALHYRC